MSAASFLFRDREDAAKALAEKLIALQPVGPVVLGIPRGGVPIARIVADALRAPLSVYVSRKIGAPSNPEFGIGAITEDGNYLLDSTSLNWVQASQRSVEAALQSEGSKCAEYVSRFRHNQPLPSLEGKTAILCDDGLATGVTMLAAVAGLKERRAEAIVAAAPVASSVAVRQLNDAGAVVVVCASPSHFQAVALFYERFDQLTDGQVTACLDRPVLYNT